MDTAARALMSGTIDRAAESLVSRRLEEPAHATCTRPRRLKAKLMGCTVTGSNCCSFEALLLDELLLRAAGLTAGEQVEVTHVVTGQLMTTTVQAAPEGSAEVSVHGRLARLIAQGDTIVVIARHPVGTGPVRPMPRVVEVDAGNRSKPDG